MQEEIEILQVEKKIRSRVKKQMEKTQKGLLRRRGGQPGAEGAAAARAQGGEAGNEFKNEIEEIEERVRRKRLPAREASVRLDRELKKLKMMSPMSAEATRGAQLRRLGAQPAVAGAYRGPPRHYGHRAGAPRGPLGFGEAQRSDPGVPRAVQALVDKPRGPILCFVGPPGGGQKRAWGQSIARSMGRRFVRLSLGGVRDEAEIRGHRRTYIGALPGEDHPVAEKGRQQQPRYSCSTKSTRCRPTSGAILPARLLEVLDPEQNATFNDHYLDLDYDLSSIMFLCTANNLQQIPAPLQDRMEVIQIPGYTDYEKAQIAKQYPSCPSSWSATASTGWRCASPRGAIHRIIGHYTPRGGGADAADREISSVCRKIAREVVRAEDEEARQGLRFKVNAKSVPRYLGPHRFSHGTVEERDEIGLTHGVAWTQYGGGNAGERGDGDARQGQVHHHRQAG